MLERANGDLSTILPEDCQPPRWWSTLPDDSKPLEPQEYSIKVCEVPLHFSGVVDPWYANLNLPNSFYLTPAGIVTGPVFSFNYIRWVCDPQKPGDPYALQDAPSDMICWFQNHPYLRVENLDEVEIGGVLGTQFDAVVSRVPDKLLPDAVRACIPLFPEAPRTSPFVLFKANKNRVIVLNVEGETIIIVIESPPNEYKRFLAKTKQILDSVKWGP
jgi:hypothetical protein